MIQFNHQGSHHPLTHHRQLAIASAAGSGAIMSPTGSSHGDHHQSQQQSQQQSQSGSPEQAHNQQQPLPLIRASHHHHHRHLPSQVMHQSEEGDFVRDTDSPPPPDLVSDHHYDRVSSRDEANGGSAVISGHQNHHSHDHYHHRHHHHHHHHHHRHQQQPHHRHHSHHVPSVAQAVAVSPPTNGCSSSVNGSISHRHDENEDDSDVTVPVVALDRISSLSHDQLSSLTCQVNHKLRISQSHRSVQTCHESELHQQQQQQLTQSPKSTATTNDWSKLPRKVLQRILSYLSLSDGVKMGYACVSWSEMILRDEDSEFWSRNCHQKIPHSLLKSDMLSSLSSMKSKLRCIAHSWNPNDCSRNIYIKSCVTLHRNPVAQSTDAARGRIGFSSGRHCWEICFEGPLGTVSVIGIATKDQPMQASGYVPLIGSCGHSWGWNLVENQLLHDGDVISNYPQMNNAPKYQTGEKIRVILDCDRHTLSFEKNYEFLGVAFVGLPPDKLIFPAVSAVYGNTEVSMVYMGFPMDG